MCAQAYVLATSSSALRVLARFRDCASSEPVSSTRDEGSSVPWLGMRESNACSICRLMAAVLCCVAGEDDDVEAVGIGCCVEKL